MSNIDHKDRKILFELDRNCRQSVNEIAHATRLSKDIVRYRIRQLEEASYIGGYITLIDFTKFGYQIVRLYLKLQNTTSDIENQIVDYVLKQDTVLIAYKTDGNYELAIGLLVKDLREYDQTYQDILTKYRPYIVGKDFTVFSDFKHYYRNYLCKESDLTELSTGSHIPYEYDDLDIRILKELSTNARISLVELSKIMNEPISTLKYRIQKLKKQKVIVAYRAIINYHKLGYEYYKVDLILEDLKIIPSLAEYIRNHPNVIYRDIVIGGSDFEFDCEMQNQDEFYQMIEEIRNMFPKKIRSYFYYKTMHTHKYSFFPNLLSKEIKP